MSLQVKSSALKPGLHLQLKEPMLFSHSLFKEHLWRFCSHSLISIHFNHGAAESEEKRMDERMDIKINIFKILRKTDFLMRKWTNTFGWIFRLLENLKWTQARRGFFPVTILRNRYELYIYPNSCCKVICKILVISASSMKGPVQLRKTQIFPQSTTKYEIY